MAFGNERGGLMGRRVSLRRFALVLCASLCFAIASGGCVDPAPSAHPQTPEAQAGTSQTAPSESKAQEQTKTEQYTLSHERQEKAIAYSRAGYTLYFVSYFLDPAAGVGGQVSRRRGKCQRPEMVSGIGFRPAAVPDHRRSGPAGTPVLACAFLALRAVHSKLGLVVLGLDQGRTARYGVWNRAGADPVRGDAAQPAALVAVFLVSRGLDSPWTDRDHPPGDRSAIQQVRAPEQGACRSGCFDRRTYETCRCSHFTGAHVSDGGEPEDERYQRLCDGAGSFEARGSLGYHDSEDFER